MEDRSSDKEYVQQWRSKFEDVRSTLRSKEWFAFNLDDTLHNFGAASSTAAEAVSRKIRADHGANTVTVTATETATCPDLDTLRKDYGIILTEKPYSAFEDRGRSSRSYHKERFKALLQKAQLSYDHDNYLESLADVYQEALAKSLQLKPGAMALLKLLNIMHKSIMIITQGPEDGQTWTLEQLRIIDFAHCIVTPNQFPDISEPGGLLLMMTEGFAIASDDIVVIGNDLSRDIQPALKAGLCAVHFDEKIGDEFESGKPMRVSSLYQLVCMIGDGTISGWQEDWD